MTMFSRSDKPAEPTVPQPPRPQAAAQPLSSTSTSAPTSAPAPAPSPVRPQSSQTPGVSVISKALKITGQLESTEDIRIDGEVEGDVRGLSVTVGQGARVKGTVYGDAVELAGAIDGRIEAKKVVLTATAHMEGDVVHQDIRIESGAYIDGHLKPEHGKAAAKPATKPSENAKA
ncbi:MAG: polymer-forming cytoskeletal protein [Alphaproteobacteria bacterium]|nr:polymer-forming cytoskeletal protein [Alphaproteobacteria bacterium]MBU6472371.1 polymer-forming cytoskeletal protein [Alphaproteobacteria bacterium]MDE2013790.1 polymer-forming cytoskeletal protein [Alphaproteobacteria bacterium]MDE2074810.1 polymer-forming cytoskeletal protein [Alphaproteobacteria bacterium]MDE2352644.1 polymer-forming cytoskeletal protein [Alphaproteobacteria bacterium]